MPKISLMATARRRVSILALVLAASATWPLASRAGDFALKNNDVVVFLGDSITARGYPKLIEHYTLMRYPDRKVTFFNGGKGGDTAQTSISRLEREVFARSATVMLIALGVNDIGWGMRADDEHKQQYLDGVRTLISECQKRKIRVFLCSAAITAEAAEKAEAGFLQKMTDEGLALAQEMGAGAIDVQRGMRAIQRPIEAHNAAEADPAKQVRLHAADGVHLNDLGQLSMAYAILKGLGAPELISSVTIDAKTGKVTESRGCEVTRIVADGSTLAFTRLDEGLPLNRGALSGLDYRWIPIPDGINRYLLTVSNLSTGKYLIRADGRRVQTVEAEKLEAGINLASMTVDPWEPGGPWDAQSTIVKELVDARDKLLLGQFYQERFDGLTSPLETLRTHYRELDASLMELQRQTARPRPYRFEISPAPPDAGAP